MNKLAEICQTKRKEVRARQTALSLSDLDRLAAQREEPRGFERALRIAATHGSALIAEIKRASPSKGLIRQDFDPADHARAYAAGGATCLSVLTDAPYFQGHEDYLIAARAACQLPVLRKDFTVDPWQVAEARAIGADAILIIIAAISDAQMVELEAAAIERSLDVLVEVHDESELDRALRLGSRLIGINNRNLKTFQTDLTTTERLSARAPDKALLVGESGITSHQDIRRLNKVGVRAFLVGESLMRQQDLVAATRALLHG